MARLVAISYFMSEYSNLCGIQVFWPEHKLLWTTINFLALTIVQYQSLIVIFAMYIQIPNIVLRIPDQF